MAASQIAVLVAAIIMLRRRRQRLAYVGLTEPPARPFTSRAKPDDLVALAAVVTKIALTVRVASADALPVPQAPAMVFTAVPAALAALLAVWAVAAPGSAWQRFFVLLMAAPALGAIGPLVCGRDDDLITWIEFTTLEAVLSGRNVVRRPIGGATGCCLQPPVRLQKCFQIVPCTRWPGVQPHERS